MEIGNCFCLAFFSGLSLSIFFFFFFFLFCSIIRHKLSHYTEISPQNLTEIVASQHSQFGRKMSKTLFDANSYVLSLITYGRRFETRFELIPIKLSLPALFAGARQTRRFGHFSKKFSSIRIGTMLHTRYHTFYLCGHIYSTDINFRG